MDYLKKLEIVDRSILQGRLYGDDRDAFFNWAWLERNRLGDLKVGVSLVTPDYPDLQLILRQQKVGEVDLIIPEHQFGHCKYQGSQILKTGLGRVNTYKFV